MVYNRSICSNDNFLHLVFAIFLDRFCSDALVTMEMLILTEKFNLNSYFTVILQVMRIKKYCRKCGLIFFLKMADRTYLVKIFLIMCHKCSEDLYQHYQLYDYIAHNSVNRSVIDLEFVNAKSKCYLKTSIMIIFGEQSSK